VFCGSNTGARPDYAEAADELAALLVEQGPVDRPLT
jgi:predicted Rossmann-fold nucleotide-binding protein